MTRKGECSAKQATKAIVLAVAVIVGLTIASGTSANGHERLKVGEGSQGASLANVTATFSENSTGFNVTSDKDLSNIIIEYCAPAPNEKLEYGDGNLTYDHAGNQTVTGIWVKSGSYSDPDGPPGAGFRFDNESAACAAEAEA